MKKTLVIGLIAVLLVVITAISMTAKALTAQEDDFKIATISKGVACEVICNGACPAAPAG